MKIDGVVPNVVTYSALITTCKRAQQFERALKFFDAMNQQGVVPNLITTAP